MSYQLAQLSTAALLTLGIERHGVGLGIKGHAVIGQYAGIRQLAHVNAKIPERSGATALLMQHGHRYAPLRLIAAMLAGQLVDAPIQRLAQSEVIAAQGQHLLALDTPKQPIGQGDFNGYHAIFAVTFDDACRVHQSKETAFTLPVSLDVGFNPRTS